MKLGGHIIIEVGLTKEKEELYRYKGAVKVTDAENGEYILSTVESKDFNKKSEAVLELQDMLCALVNYALTDVQG